MSTAQNSGLRRVLTSRWCTPCALLSLWTTVAWGATDLRNAEEAFLSGDYAGVIQAAQKGVSQHADDEDWQLLLSRALLAVGRYPDARRAMTNALARDARSIRLRWQAREVFLNNGQPEAATLTVQGILGLVADRSWNYRDAASVVAYGRSVLLHGADPKKVLDQLFEPARQAEPNLKDVYLAPGELALEKHDFALAAKRFEEGLKKFPNDPDLNYGLAQAYAPSDLSLMGAAVDSVLARNSNHVGCLLLLVDQRVDAEDYAEAEKLLDRIERVNPWRAEAWAYRAVLAQLRHRPAEETAAREKALKFWATNPLVDHLVGRKLSQKYLFSEGAAHQRRALEFDPDYLPAKAQLAQDLLRLGEETEGWRLADAVQKEDGYDVEAFNLTTLHATMKKFTTLTNEDFILRMGSHEAEVYGRRVLALLSQARSNLCAKYGIEVKRPTIVEVFPDQKDFAVRTFGMPGNPGYLGVCFGSVVTATSPLAHGGRPVNWEAVLWHEFCHVVTLQLTRNRMPRWLSEGISVYEELQANPSWGQRMTPRYREMALGDDLTPLSKLSGAFLAPESEMHLQFAYYESSLVVEFLVEQFGLPALRAILKDLGEGTEINEALAKNTVPMSSLEEQFTAFAKKRAENLAPGLDFEKPAFETARALAAPRRRSRGGRPAEPPRSRAPTNAEPAGTAEAPAAETWDTWAKAHPTNFWVMTREADRLIEAKDWNAAQPLLEALITAFPEFVGPDSAYRQLATTHRELRQTNAELQILTRFAEKDDEATDAYSRLMELSASAGDWPAVFTNAERYLAVNPLAPAAYRRLAEASEQGGKGPLALNAYRALLRLDPPDSADVHFRVAQLLHRAGDPGARREVLQALEETPRFRDALQLLSEIAAEPAAPRPGEKPAVQ